MKSRESEIREYKRIKRSSERNEKKKKRIDLPHVWWNSTQNIKAKPVSLLAFLL